MKAYPDSKTVCISDFIKQKYKKRRALSTLLLYQHYCYLCIYEPFITRALGVQINLHRLMRAILKLARSIIPIYIMHMQFSKHSTTSIYNCSITNHLVKIKIQQELLKGLDKKRSILYALAFNTHCLVNIQLLVKPRFKSMQFIYLVDYTVT